MKKISKDKLDELERFNISPKGRSVIYDNYGKLEKGYITSWNDHFVFVCFDKSDCGIACPYDKVRAE